MDGLLAEINSKRKALTELDGGSGEGSSKKYMRRADVERAREEEERRKRAEAKAAAEEAKSGDRAAALRREAEAARKASSSRSTASPQPDGSNAAASSSSGTAVGITTTSAEPFKISPEEVNRRLRAKGQPIRFFGETEQERRARLRELELMEERGTTSSQGFNDFRKLMADMESGYEAREEEKKTRAAHKATDTSVTENGNGSAAGGGGVQDEKARRKAEERRKAENIGVLDLNLVKTDPGKLNPAIYYALKWYRTWLELIFQNVLREWEEWMDARPEEVKRTTAGKLASANTLASAQNLKPLFKSLRSRDLSPEVVRLLSEIVHYMQTRSYQQANDAYLRLSIGNAAWPIGVTSVGIHERGSREKIYQDVIGHVLNDEVSRKWIQAIKRLLTFSQTVRPPDDISQMMG